ncbi:response regulator [Sphingomonas melonis]|jgi:DNA-binding NtrC family response regulator|uniref:Response regulator n=1 Tax=Sphingomonas naphthae TaxID=1813468 RepID=A0ABY7TQZ3_9SPHN|nr:response regulator [Sphingomonas naphthae]WCT75648.1 response regulator [Sphingomonas naphthae]
MHLDVVELTDLSHAKWRVFEAENADTAIAILDQHQEIRVVLTDVQMPGSMDGVKLAHYVRDRFPPTVLFVVSGDAPIPESELPAQATFLPKPFDPHRLLRQIESMARA